MRLSDRVHYVAAYVLGFFLPFNVYLFPWMSQTPRAIDALGLAIACTFAGGLLLHRHVKVSSLYRMLFVGVLIVPVVWHGVVSGQSGTTVYAVRWIIALFWAGVMWRLSTTDETRSIFFRSMLAGCVGCVGVIVLQFAGFLELTQAIGLAPQDSLSDVSFLSIWRVPGMEKHVNGSAAIVSLATPLVIGLVEEKRLGRKWLLIVLGAVALSSALTLNRSSILVTGATLLAWVMLSKSKWITGRTRLLVVIAALSGVLIYGPPGGWQRWQDLSNLTQSGNVEVRVETTLGALWLALNNPLGMGLEYTEILPRLSGTGSGATHNAFLQIALRGGWPIFIAMVAKLGYASAMLLRRSSLEGWIALHLFGLFFFEEYMSNFTIVILVIWLLLRSPGETWFAPDSRRSTARSPVEENQ